MRSKYGTYKEYTSEDNLNFISKEGLAGPLDIYKKIASVIENNLSIINKRNLLYLNMNCPT